MKKGFTLTELLVVTAIIAILSLITFPNYNKFHQSLNLDQSAARLVQDFRRAQELAISAKPHEPCRKWSGNFHSDYDYGYGIRATAGTTSYTIFGDCVGNPGLGNDEEVETVSLEPGIQISSITVSPAWVVFSPPEPEVEMKSNLENMSITLINDYGQTKTIFVNKAGLIYAQ